MIIKGTKEESKLIRWLQKATTKSEDRSLDGIYVCDGHVVACDGIRMHAAPTPDCLKKWDGIWDGRVPSGDFAADLEQVEGIYPDYNQIMPTDPPQYEIAMSARLLIEALQGMKEDSNMVIFRFRGKHDPVEIFGPEAKVYALLMPMKCRDLALWRPQSDKQKQADKEMRERIKRKLAEAEAKLANQELANASSR